MSRMGGMSCRDYRGVLELSILLQRHRFMDPDIDFVETATCTGIRVGDYEEGDRQ